MRTLVWAHRGASAYAPENTLPAFEKAAEMQADGVELDVQLTSDGELVVTHDESIERVSDSRAAPGLWKPSEFSAVHHSQ